MPKDKKPGPRRKKLTIVFDDKTRKYDHVFIFVVIFTLHTVRNFNVI